MEFEWDEAKKETCHVKRGFDFTHVIRAFLDPRRVVQRDTRRNYGEDRSQLVGRPGRVFFANSLRGDALRIIYARKAKRREVREYETAAH